MIIKSFSDIFMHPKTTKEATPSICKGLVELIFGRKRVAFGDGLADNEIDLAEVPAEFHENDSSFDRQTF